jgi:hypothetical protein
MTFGMPFRTLPLWLRQYYWQSTKYGKHPASDYLMWMIESISEEAAIDLARGDAERVKQTWGTDPKLTESQRTEMVEYVTARLARGATLDQTDKQKIEGTEVTFPRGRVIKKCNCEVKIEGPS